MSAEGLAVDSRRENTMSFAFHNRNSASSYPLEPTAIPGPVVTAGLIAVLGMLFAFGSSVWMHDRNETRTAERFESLVNRIALQIEGRLAKYEYGLRGARGAIIAAGEEDVTRDTFRRYSLSRDIEHEFPGARGFGFIRRVPVEAESAFVSRARADGAPDFSVRQLTPQPGERFVIKYIEPIEHNQEAVGLDVASERHRKAAALAALESGRATLTAPITLVQATGMKARGFLLFLPVFKPNASLTTAEERRAASVGWTYAPLVIDEVLNGLDLDRDKLSLSLVDRTQETTVPFFSNTGSSLQPERQATENLERTRAVQVFGRTWDIQVAATPGFWTDISLTPPAIVGGIIAVGSLLMAGLAYLRMAGRRREVLAGLEKSRMAAVVTEASDAIIGKTLDGVITDWNPAAERLFGYTAAEAVGRKAADLIVPPYLHPEEEDALARVSQGLSVPYFATQRQRRDGSMLPMRISVSPIRAPDGRPAGAAITAQDISEQLAAEESIRRLNATLEQQVAERTAQLQATSVLQAAILDHAGYAVIATDMQGTITLFNPAAERMLGYAADDLVGKGSPSIFHDAAEVAVRATSLSAELRQTIPPGFEVFVARTKRGLPNIDEWTYITKSGKRVPVLLNISALRSEDGQDIGFLGIASDLTEQHRHEAELKATGAGTWSYNVATGRVRMSAECARQHGFSDVAIEIDVETEWKPLAHPDDVPQVLLELERVIAHGGDYTMEYRFLLPQGGTRWVATLGRAEVDGDGQVKRVVGLTLDTTARKQAERALRESEQRYRILAENTAEMIVQTDMDAVRRYVSPACRTILGYEPDELIGRKPFEIVHPDDLQEVSAVISDLAQGRRTEAVQRQRYQRKDGGYVWVEVSYRIFHDAEGQPIGCMACTRDISQQHAHAEALQEAKATAERASQAKTDFLAAMSHEIRTPLNAIIGFTDLMVGSGRLDPQMQRQAELVHTSGAALLTVVNDILDFSKVEAGAIELLHEPFPPRTLVDNCVSIVRSLALPKGLEVRTAIHAALPPGLLGDQARLRQVLLNLLNNAVKFTKIGSVTLAVHHEGVTAAGERLRFSVKDSGIGIPKDKQARLFQRFSQVDGSIQRDYGGTGLGLAICKRLVELMGGEIGVVSEEGQGATFWFTVTLPRVVLADRLAPVTNTPTTRRKGHLLLVEDVAINQELALAVLQVAGHTVDVVSNGADAVKAVEDGAYDLVLMDVQMPGMDGLTATRLIRCLKTPAARVPIVAMTANVLPDEVRSFREAGMDDHVGKPFNRAELYATIDKWLSGTAATQPAVTVDVVPNTFDRPTYEATTGLLRPGRVVGVLTAFLNELEHSFVGPTATAHDRTRLRHAAHALSSAAGMIGFTDLSVACHALEACSEARLDDEGVKIFAATLAQVRTLAAASATHVQQLAVEAGRNLAPSSAANR